MKICITVDMLKKMDACSRGIKLFQELHGNKLEIEWKENAHIEFLENSPLKIYFGWILAKGLIPR